MSSVEADLAYDVSEVPVEEVDLHEARENLDRLAQGFLGMPGEEFLAKRGRGELDDLRGTPGFARVDAVATLMD